MRSVVGRYYYAKFATSEQIPQIKKDEDQYVYQHHNGLCIVGLAPSHPIFQLNLTIDHIDFQIGDKDRSQTKVRGKKKKGGDMVHPDTVICRIFTVNPEYVENKMEETKNENEAQSEIVETVILPAKRVLENPETEGQDKKKQKTENVGLKEWSVRACIRGSMIEPNKSLMTNPNLLKDKVHLIAISNLPANSLLILQNRRLHQDILQSLCQDLRKCTQLHKNY